MRKVQEIRSFVEAFHPAFLAQYSVFSVIEAIEDYAGKDNIKLAFRFPEQDMRIQSGANHNISFGGRCKIL